VALCLPVQEGGEKFCGSDMSDTVIKAEGLGKKYIISHEAPEKYTTLREVIQRKTKALFRRPRNAGSSKEEFWALKNINFELKRGEAIGIIGRNGAGKSTLLKILSRITEPTEGRVAINGRTSSLLEVGTGFHPELTGRENIFLNGAVLGMSRAEIKKKFDAIVDFSGVEKFLDTPVKRYSSGMYLRLAFAVAAHLEPERLIVDEVLAVGDAEFQKKCLGKMDEVSRQEGRTVLFVSHNMNAVMQLCKKVILLDAGEITAINDAEPVIKKYLSATISDTTVPEDLSLRKKDRKGTGQFRFQKIEVLDYLYSPSNSFYIGDEIIISFTLKRTDQQINFSSLVILIKTSDEIPLAHVINTDSGFKTKHEGSIERYLVRFKDVRFFPGDYIIDLGCYSTDSHEAYDHIFYAASFRIIEGGKLASRYLPRHAGFFFLNPDWEKAQ
jgi:lipopolysaccharide transport system ATP-binding protein